jgi:iron complex transport system substrate-binding protein
MRDLLRCCVWLLCLWGGALQALTVTDDRQVQVTLERAPKRIVSLLPSLTETVCVLGACDRLVGVDRYSNWPQSVARLPHLGGLEDTQVEALVRLKPDLVLLARSSRVTSRLESLGLKVLALEPQNLADVQRVLLTLAQVLALQIGDHRALKLNRSRRRFIEAVDHAQQRGLARTRAANDADKAARRHRQRHAVYRVGIAKALAEIAKVKCVHGRSWRCACCPAGSGWRELRQHVCQRGDSN